MVGGIAPAGLGFAVAPNPRAIRETPLRGSLVWGGRPDGSFEGLPATRIAGDKPPRYIDLVSDSRSFDRRFTVGLWCVDSRLRGYDDVGATE